jgi:hypothetical protein
MNGGLLRFFFISIRKPTYFIAGTIIEEKMAPKDTQRTFFLVVALLAVVFLAPALVEAQTPPVKRPIIDERILPISTKGAFIVTNAIELAERWRATGLGQLMNDPVMKPFTEDLKRQFSERLSRLRDRLGLQIDDLRGVPGGGLSLVLTQPKQGEAAIGLLVDVTDHIPQAEKLLGKVAVNLTDRGGKMSKQQVGQTTIIIFDLPATDDMPATRVGYFLTNNLLGASDNLDLMKEVLQRQMGLPQDSVSLAELPAFKEVMRRCQADAGSAIPQIRWFIQPLGYIEAVRATIPEEKRRRRGGSIFLDIVEQQGFSAIEGIGGHIDLKAGPFELLHRTATYAPGPYKQAPAPYKNLIPMEVFSCPNATDFTPPAWVPGDVASCATLYWDIAKAFKNMGPIFDQIVGEGKETGVWEDTLDSLLQDPDAPQIDIRKEIVKYLGQRIVVVSDYELPITPTSERILVAVETGDPAAMAAGIKKLLKNDPIVRRHEFEGKVIWEFMTEEELANDPNQPVIDLPDLADDDEFEEEGENRLFPNMSITVVHGQILIASQYDFLIKILKSKGDEPLSESIDFRIVQSAMKQLGVGPTFLRTFARTDEELRPVYELIRQNRMGESETLFGRLLTAISTDKKKNEPREQKIDGHLLPDFQVVRRYLGPAGLFSRNDDDGWLFTGFMLHK